MLLTLESLSATLIQQLGRTPARSTLEELVNEAGEAWVNAFSWRYLRDREQTIQTETGVGQYKLNLGVRSVGDKLLRGNTIWPPVPVLAFSEFLKRREQYLSDVAYQLRPIATTSWNQGEGDDRPRLYVDIYPAELDEVLTVQYQAGWLPLDKPSDVADIPPPLVQPFTEWIRRYAMAREKPEMGGIDQMAVQFLGGPLGIQAKTVDAESVGKIIPAPGGAGARWRAKNAGTRGDFEQLERLRYHTPQ